MTLPSSPVARRLRQPSWINFRFAAGLLLVLGSTVLGANLLTPDDQTVSVWSVRKDLVAGTILVQADLQQVKAQLPDLAARYVTSSSAPVGHTLTRPMRAGELLPVAALDTQPTGVLISLPLDEITVPPSLERGTKIDLWWEPDGMPAQRVMASAAVQSVARSGDGLAAGNGKAQVVVSSHPEQVQQVVTALSAGHTYITVWEETDAKGLADDGGSTEK